MTLPVTKLKKPAVGVEQLGCVSPSAHAHRVSSTGTSNYAVALPEEYALNLPALKDYAVSECPGLLLKKLKLCTFVFDFKNENPMEAQAKELKTQTLIELIEHLQMPINSFSAALFGHVFAMFSANAFRAFQPVPYRSGLDPPDEDEPFLDDAWPHLQLVYDFFTRFLLFFVERDLKALKKYVNQNFVVSLLELFDTEDSREREVLKSILHRVYAKFLSLRTHIRTAINNVFFRFVFDTHHHNGMAELLEILGAIVNGFALPLKDEHKNFLILVLTPLHKANIFAAYYPQFTYCVNQFVEKDASLSVPIFTQCVFLLAYF